MHSLIPFVVRYGYWLVFGWVLAEQLGVPVPSLPLLLAVGAIAAMGGLNAWWAVALAVLASLLADVVWFELGRRRGSQVLRFLCRIALQPDSCVRRTEGTFEKYGASSLLLAKFVPGLNTAAPPMAGATKMPFARFALFDAGGALLWSGAAVSAGYIFANQLDDLARLLLRVGHTAGSLLLGAAFVGYVAEKVEARRRFLKQLAKDRIGPEEVKKRMDAGEELFIVDLRHPLDFLPDPRVIPGAVRMSPEDLDTRAAEIPRDREIIVYCT